MKDYRNQIISLFKLRDQAVSENNQALFLSTQISEIKNSGSNGYLKIQKLTSKVLHIHKDKEQNLWIVLVQEKYYYDDQFSHSIYLLYKVIQKENGKLFISDISW